MVTTKLGGALASGTPGAKPAVSRFMAALAGKRIFEPIVVPVVELPAVMTILGGERSLDIEGDVTRAMEQRGIPQNIATQGKYELELATRTLAEAVLESRENPIPFGSVKEWGQLPAEAIGAIWFDYMSLREMHDPTGVTIDEDDIAMIREAVSKKNSTTLHAFGVRRLCAFLLTTADPPAISPTPKSESGDKSSES